MSLLTIRNRFGKALAAPLCTAMLLTTACQGDAAAPQDARVDYDGAMLYRGLVLGDGPVASFIPGVRDNMRLEDFVSDPAILRQVRARHELLIGLIQQRDPQFFERFEQAMESGDHVRIAEALEGATQVTLGAALAMGGEENLRENRTQVRDAIVAQLAVAGKDTPENRTDVDRLLAAVAQADSESQTAAEEAARSLGVVFVAGVLVYVVAAIEVAVVSNVAVAIAGVKYLALTGVSLQDRDTGNVLEGQIVHSIATTLHH